jgi:hypothetical protein
VAFVDSKFPAPHAAVTCWGLRPEDGGQGALGVRGLSGDQRGQGHRPSVGHAWWRASFGVFLCMHNCVPCLGTVGRQAAELRDRIVVAEEERDAARDKEEE